MFTTIGQLRRFIKEELDSDKKMKDSIDTFKKQLIDYDATEKMRDALTIRKGKTEPTRETSGTTATVPTRPTRPTKPAAGTKPTSAGPSDADKKQKKDREEILTKLDDLKKDLGGDSGDEE